VSIHRGNTEKFLRLVVSPRAADKTFGRWGKEMVVPRKIGKRPLTLAG
jgi:hypothetical protein